MAFEVRLLDLSDPRRAKGELEAVGADPAGVAKMVPKASFLAFKATGIKAPGANILKQEALAAGAEAAVSRGVINCSVARTDVVILGTRKEIRALVRRLKPQPFGLKRLAAELEAVLGAVERRFELPWARGVLRLSERPHIMGILNVTPDSFSDGGEFLGRDEALARAEQMVAEGADLIDVGGESSRPGAEPVDEAVELSRVLPVIEHLAPRLPVPVSVDTYRAGVAEAAAAAGASIVNDISGLAADPAMAETVARTGAAVVVMHMRGTPRTMQSDTAYGDLLGEVCRSLRESAERALAAGVPAEKIVVDPGLGFGKTAEGNLVLLGRLGELRSLGYPVLAGASRKSFLGKVLGTEDPKDRLEGSLAAAAVAVWNGAHILRVHDVRETRRAAEVAWAVRQARGG
ncbi:MAG: dihydropteroate synthase [Deltaproteobacteria bacterium]|nr:dihydropteroate synthase [Deltaproteobacteria bacterium]